MPTLVIANKLYSSWSLRPWLMLREAGIAFDEELIRLGEPDTAERIARHSGAGRVPILVDGDVTVFESIAIAEYAAERWPDAGLWPEDRKARAHARSIAAEMHAGFSALRSACPMNLGKRFAARERGEAVSRDVARVEGLWREARARFGKDGPMRGPFLFGRFSAADAMYAPVATRLDTYAIPVAADTRAYMEAVLGLASFRDWRDAALAEPWTLAVDETDDRVVEDLRRVDAPRRNPAL